MGRTLCSPPRPGFLIGVALVGGWLFVHVVGDGHAQAQPAETRIADEQSRPPYR
jgi:hypothetical protein